MSTRPLKFPLALGDNEIEVPGPASGPHFAYQIVDGKEVPTLWLTVREVGAIQFQIYPRKVKIFVGLTGQALPSRNWEHLGSALNADTTFVAHCYRIED